MTMETQNAAKLQKIMEILAYFSTPEGQLALMGYVDGSMTMEAAMAHCDAAMEALVLANQLAYGEMGNFYVGDITDKLLNLVSLDYVSGKVPDYNRLVTVNLTGAQRQEKYPLPETAALPSSGTLYPQTKTK